MTATPLADVDDVAEALLRPLTTAETTYVPGLIAKASSLLRIAMPAIDQRITAFGSDPSGLDPVAVASVIAGVIKRYIANPTGAASTSKTAGPYSQTVSFISRGKSIGTSGVLEITAADLAALNEAVGFSMPGTIRTRPVQHCRRDPWLFEVPLIL